MNTLSSLFLVRRIVRSQLWLTCLALDAVGWLTGLRIDSPAADRTLLQHSLKPTQQFPRRSNDMGARLTTRSPPSSAKVRDECSLSPVLSPHCTHTSPCTSLQPQSSPFPALYTNLTLYLLTASVQSFPRTVHTPHPVFPYSLSPVLSAYTYCKKFVTSKTATMNFLWLLADVRRQPTLPVTCRILPLKAFLPNCPDFPMSFAFWKVPRLCPSLLFSEINT